MAHARFHVLLASLLFVGLLAGVTPSWGGVSPMSIGKVVLVRGQAARDAQFSSILHENDSIREKDSVYTGNASLLQIRLSDQSLITLGPKTIFTFTNFPASKNGKGRALLQFVQGQMRAALTKRSANSELTFDTKYSAFGIRGTEIMINGTVNAKGDEITQLGLLSGKVDVFDKVKKKTTALHPGEQRIAIVDASQTAVTSGTIRIHDTRLKSYLAQSSTLDSPTKLKNWRDDESKVLLAAGKDGQDGFPEAELFLDTYAGNGSDLK